MSPGAGFGLEGQPELPYQVGVLAGLSPSQPEPCAI